MRFVILVRLGTALLYDPQLGRTIEIKLRRALFAYLFLIVSLEEMVL
jgi:hypothetical protein